MTEYDDRFFEAQRGGARRSADAIAPLLLALAAPQSVVDVGCGTGAWLSAFRARGVEDVVGVDGAYVPEALRELPPDRFVAADLGAPLHLGRRFDLVLCLEVAEHLPADRAETLVDSLTGLGDLVAFSAAVPGQLGEGHVNEQWQDWWAERFAARGYVAVDAIRRHVWDDSRVEWWYAQNLLLYAAPPALLRRPELRAEHELLGTRQLRVVHPRFLEWREHVSLGNRVRRALRMT